jgi:hypothetical protein
MTIIEVFFSLACFRVIVDAGETETQLSMISMKEWQ